MRDDFERLFTPPRRMIDRDVYVGGSGPAIVLLHELPGMTEECCRLAVMLVNEGFTVYLPLLFGKAGERSGANFFRVCISSEFHLFRKHSSGPIVDKLRELCRQVFAEKPETKGIGVIGMCLTGGFVMTMLVEPAVIAGVISQPALPIGFGSRQRALAVRKEDLAVATSRDIPLMLLRFSEDDISPRKRADAIQQTFPKVEFHEICSKRGNPDGLSPQAHSVLTDELRVNDPQHPTMKVYRRVVEYLKQQIG